MQCITCQGTKKDESNKKCWDCRGTGYTLPDHMIRAREEKAQIELMSINHTQAAYNASKIR